MNNICMLLVEYLAFRISHVKFYNNHCCLQLNFQEIQFFFGKIIICLFALNDLVIFLTTLPEERKQKFHNIYSLVLL